MGTEVDENAKRELDLFAENEGKLHPQFQSIIANITKKIAKGAYEPTLAPKLWLYWYDAAAEEYVRQFGAPEANESRRHEARQMFPTNLRQELAEGRATYEYERIQRGEYS